MKQNSKFGLFFRGFVIGYFKQIDLFSSAEYAVVTRLGGIFAF
ncbi:hypothetical protein VCHA53O464_10157 [Vibrio chagasii]|nr:hypothetical protein VCHA53O464_10157 [Vibrio chagasii]